MKVVVAVAVLIFGIAVLLVQADNYFADAPEPTPTTTFTPAPQLDDCDIYGTRPFAVLQR
jgi:hypothetical protein